MKAGDFFSADVLIPLGTFALLQLLVLLLLYGFGFSRLDDLDYALYTEDLGGHLIDARRVFDGASVSEWEDRRQILLQGGEREVTFLAPDDEDLEDAVRETFVTFIANASYVDDTFGAVYLRLDESTLLEVSPYASTAFGDYVPELGAYLTAVLTSLLFIAALLLHRERKKRQLSQTWALGKDHSDAGGSAIDVGKLLSQYRDTLEETERATEAQLAVHKDLLHGVAHELRSPMSRIQFAIYMLEERHQDSRGDANDPAIDELITSVKSSLDELESMIAELLSFARLQHEGAVALDERASVSAIASDALKKVASVYTNIDYRLDDRSAGQALLLNRAQLHRAITNLLRNAGRYAHSACELVVEIRGDNLVILVDDDGDGIPPGKRERVFEPFTRLDPSRSRDSGGAGLGLAIVKSVIDLHGGNVSITDSPIGGARLQITLPFA